MSKRLRELSIRVGLGAEAKQVLSASLGRMLILFGSGPAIGIALGVAATRALTGPLSVAGPVRRALRIDSANLLREQ